MTLRWVPPAHSPVRPVALVRGGLTAAGLAAAHESEVIDTLARRFGSGRITLTDSGTSALVLALKATVPRGEAVAFPAYCCIDLITAAQGAGVKVRLYDVDPATISPDLDSLRRAVQRGVSAVVIAPLFGYPVDVEGVGAIAAEAGIPVVEDAAQSAGSTFHGRRIGSFGALTVLSFARGKGTTGGSGGALLVRDSAYFESAGQLTSSLAGGSSGAADVVKLGAQWMLGRPSAYWLPSSIPALRLGEMIYHAPHPPRAISRAAASMLRAALEQDDAEVAVRRSHAAEIVAGGESAGFAFTSAIAGGAPGYLRLAIHDLTGKAVPAPRSGVLRGYPITLDEHEMSRGVLLDGEAAGAGARVLRDNLFTLPVHSRMTPADVRGITSWLASLSV
jgi:dTDP-4-amino-4,6-dideoxygalactose transaminase